MDGGVIDMCFHIAFCLVHILQQLHDFFNIVFGSMANFGSLLKEQAHSPAADHCIVTISTLRSSEAHNESNSLVIDLINWTVPRVQQFFLLKCCPSYPWIGDGNIVMKHF